MSTAVPQVNIPEDEKPLRRIVALAYRAAREAGEHEHDAYEAALAAYRRERPDDGHDAASERVGEMIASAIKADPVWFWKNVRIEPDRRRAIAHDD
jgi:hypothetical protein